MQERKHFFACFTLTYICLLTSVPANTLPLAPSPTEPFTHHAILDTDGRFHLFWKFNFTHVTFESHVKTHGYVGVGLSKSGQMFPADVALGWIHNGQIHFKDRHTTGYHEPEVDASQDWHLVHAEENQAGTTIKTTRKLDTQDPNDVTITNGTMHIIYAFSDHEPGNAHEKLTHHTHRGTKSLVLLSEPNPDYVTMSQNKVPTASTTEHCPVEHPTDKYQFKSVLDPQGKYLLFWNANKTHITFEIHVETTGYIGFGLSPNGNMYPADVIIGGVKDGVPYFKDRHTVGHSVPAVDASQDWSLLYARESHCRTILTMTRKLDTCDEHDLNITDNTVKVIYSYHTEDPSDQDNIPYHGMMRGVRSLLLLSKMTPPSIPSDVTNIDILNRHYKVPANDTTYSCQIFDLSHLGRKHHMVKFEVLVEKGHETLVHHLLVHKCPGIDRSLIGAPNYMCYHDPDLKRRPCGHMMVVWAVGAEAFYFPEEAALPISEPGDTDLYIMEIHYNNPELRSDFVDNSGVRLTVTPTLRPHDAGILEISAFVDKSQVIPPHQPKFVSTGFCPRACMHQGLHQMPNGVHVFAVQQHAHLLARGIRTRLIRNGVEQEPLADDTHYDFNYQDFRQINRTLKDGDSAIVECTLNSTERTKITYGGFSTAEEMCVSFLFHYPRIQLMNCISKPLYDRLHPDPDPKSMVGTDISAKFENMDWLNTSVVNSFYESLDSSTYFMLCGSIHHVYHSNFTNANNEYPRIPYKPQGSGC